MEDMNNDMSMQEREGQVVVKVEFMFHDLELIGDGLHSIYFWQPKTNIASLRNTMQILGPTISG